MAEMMQLLGVPVKVHPGLVQPIGLPVLYGMLFRLSEVEIAGRRCLMAHDTGVMRLTPAAIRKHTEVLRAHFELPVVYVGGEGVAHLGRRLSQYGVAHIIPGKRVFYLFSVCCSKRTCPEGYIEPSLEPVHNWLYWRFCITE